MALLNTAIANCSHFDVLAESAAEIALYNFGWQYASLILFNASVFCGIDVFIKLYNKSVIIGQSTFNTWFVENTSQFVLFLDNINDLAVLLEWLKYNRFNNTGKYLILCYSSHENGCNEHTVANTLWDYQIANVVFIKHDASQKACGFTYFPDESCRNSSPVKLEKWDSCFQKNTEKYCRDIFPLKFNNLYMCPLIVSTFIQDPFMFIENGVPTGADGDLLRVIMKSLNASLVLMTPQLGEGWGKMEDNGTWTGSLGDVYYDWANFSMTSAAITLRRFSYFQMSTNYYVVNLVWVTHPSQLEPPAFKLIRPYDVEARIGLVIMIASILVTTLFFKTKVWKQITRKFNLDEVPDNILFHSWEICMGLPATRLPSKWVMLCCTLLWIWYCYLLRTLYQVYLINCLQTDFRLNDILSIEDAIDAGYPFGGGLALKDYYIDYPHIYHNWQNIESNEIYNVMTKLSNGMKFVLAMNFPAARAYLKKPTRKLHILPQNIVTSPTVIFFKKYSWLAPSINNILTRLVESGLAEKINKENTFIRKYDDSDSALPIDLEEFSGCFVIIMAGWSASMIAFLLEKYVYSRKYPLNKPEIKK